MVIILIKSMEYLMELLIIYCLLWKIFLTFKNVLKKLNNSAVEANPKSDLNGEDVKSKLQILTALAFNFILINQILTLREYLI